MVIGSSFRLQVVPVRPETKQSALQDSEEARAAHDACHIEEEAQVDQRIDHRVGQKAKRRRRSGDAPHEGPSCSSDHCPKEAGIDQPLEAGREATERVQPCA
mmetsp:Transcript_81821/g.240207  ORF Transcript_81821/g.240207 Transcript_81821/m.240207 type:complete len:102 (-) Transcript_81821:103-408(-)